MESVAINYGMENLNKEQDYDEKSNIKNDIKVSIFDDLMVDIRKVFI